MHAAQGILTATGGKTSHAAVVARGWGKCCIVGCEKLSIDYERKNFSANGYTIREGEYVTLDGSNGSVYKGALKLITPKLPESYEILMKWVDEIRTLKVRTNADTRMTPSMDETRSRGNRSLPHGAYVFRFGGTHTRHQADDHRRNRGGPEKSSGETPAIPDKRLRGHLHRNERLRRYNQAHRSAAPRVRPPRRCRTKSPRQGRGRKLDFVKDRVEKLHEANPMLGHRGCRLTITYPEILEMQVTAIMTAACNTARQGIKVFPEIMIPLVIDAKEFSILETLTRKIADEVVAKSGQKVNYMVGTMIETPRAAILADEIARFAEFFRLEPTT